MEQVGSKRCEFESERTSRPEAPSGIFGLEDSTALRKSIDSSSHIPTQLKKTRKTVFLERNGFENRDGSKLEKFRSCWNTTIPMQERYRQFFSPKTQKKRQLVFDLGRTNQAFSYRETSLKVEIYQY